VNQSEDPGPAQAFSSLQAIQVPQHDPFVLCKKYKRKISVSDIFNTQGPLALFNDAFHFDSSKHDIECATSAENNKKLHQHQSFGSYL
jgi:hypothetical protein